MFRLKEVPRGAHRQTLEAPTAEDMFEKSGLIAIKRRVNESNPLALDGRYMSIHDHPEWQDVVGLGQMHLRVGPDEFVARHMDYRAVSGLSETLGAFTTMPRCEDVPTLVRDESFRPYLTVLETAWVSEHGDTYNEHFPSPRHRLNYNRLSDLVEESHYSLQSGLFDAFENDMIIPDPVTVDNVTYALHVNVFMEEMRGDVTIRHVGRVSDLHCSCVNHTLRDYRFGCQTCEGDMFALDDERRHMSNVRSSVSRQPYQHLRSSNTSQGTSMTILTSPLRTPRFRCDRSNGEERSSDTPWHCPSRWST